MTMKPDEAAKVLRRHNEWRRGADDNHWQQSPYSPAELGHAIDAAVAALEAVAGAEPVAWIETGQLAGGIFKKKEHCIGPHKPLYTTPQPAACAKCKEKTSTPTNNDHEDDAA